MNSCETLVNSMLNVMNSSNWDELNKQVQTKTEEEQLALATICVYLLAPRPDLFKLVGAITQDVKDGKNDIEIKLRTLNKRFANLAKDICSLVMPGSVHEILYDLDLEGQKTIFMMCSDITSSAIAEGLVKRSGFDSDIEEKIAALKIRKDGGDETRDIFLLHDVETKFPKEVHNEKENNTTEQATGSSET